ncbi:MAG: hypothetical protein IPG81_00680 [Sandaracinaceae bacterium]|nr:hypothetical protein [Sandaracinaceae bacterium]
MQTPRRSGLDVPPAFWQAGGIEPSRERRAPPLLPRAHTLWAAHVRRLTLLAVLGVAGLVPGCGSSRCIDQDLDGFGRHCGRPDCDDRNAARNTDCEAVPPPDCEANPLATGCPCVVLATTGCFPADAVTEDVGLCRAGTSVCTSGFWGACRNATLPVPEVCDGSDQDCDGRVDDGVRSPCGGCDARCVGGVWGEGEAPFEGEASAGTALTREGWLTLARTPLASESLFVPNTNDNTVTRIDVQSAEAVALYESGGSEPTRVAVDWRGDVFVVNREFGGISTLRKITTDLDRCVDRDMSGTIETSTDPLVALPNDECVLFTVPIGGVNEVGRAIALDGSLTNFDGVESGGDVWVGLHHGEAFLHLDGETGELRERVETPGFQPYEATFDAFGNLYAISRDGYLLTLPRARVGELTVLAVPLACYLLYGLAADADGRLLMSGFSCDQVTLHDPAARTFRRLETLPSPRSVAITAGGAWVAHTDGRASRLALDPLRVMQTVDLGGPIETLGAAADAAGRIWLVSSQESFGVSRGRASALNATTGAPMASVDLGTLPHAQGDLSGGRLLGVAAPEGTASHVFMGCGNELTRWDRLHVSWLAGADSSVEVWLRHATTAAGLAAVSFEQVLLLPGGEVPVDLSLPTGGVVEVRLVMRTAARDGAPRVERVGLEWRCDDFG